MRIVSWKEPDGQRFILPVNRIQAVIFRTTPKFRVEVYHEAPVANPYVLYEGDSEEEARKWHDIVLSELTRC